MKSCSGLDFSFKGDIGWPSCHSILIGTHGFLCIFILVTEFAVKHALNHTCLTRSVNADALSADCPCVRFAFLTMRVLQVFVVLLLYNLVNI